MSSAKRRLPSSTVVQAAKRPKPGADKKHQNTKPSLAPLATNKTAPNRFRFQTFHDRISTISIDSFTKLSGLHGLNPDTGSGSWFMEAMEAWRELNYTTAFQQVLDVVSPMAVSLPAVLFHKEQLVKELTTAMSKGANSKGLLPPTANLLAMLMKDLEEELYPWFPVIFESTARALVSATESEDVEAAFSCLVYSLKLMHERVLQDIDSVCRDLFIPLFKSSKKPYMRRLACYSYSFLIRSTDSVDPVTALVKNANCSAVIECAVDSIILSIVDSDTGKQRSKSVFERVVGLCFDLGERPFIDVLVGKLAERMCEHESLFALITVNISKIGDGALQMVLLKTRPTESLITAMTDRLAPNPSLLVSLLVKMNFERLLSNRLVIIKIINSMSDDDFLVALTALVQMKWSLFKVIFPTILEQRVVDSRLLVVLATMRQSVGADIDWSKIKVNISTDGKCPEAMIEFGIKPSVDIGSIDVAEFKVATVSQMLKHGLEVDNKIVAQFITHPAVFCAVDNPSSELILLALASTEERVRRHALHCLSTTQPGRIVGLLNKVDTIPTDLDHYRDRLLAMRQLELLLKDANSVTEQEIELIMSFLLGVGQVKLTVLWPETFRILSVFVEKWPFVFERLFGRVFEYAVSKSRENESYSFTSAPSTLDVEVVLGQVIERCKSLDGLRMYFASLVLQSPSYSLLSSEGVSVWMRIMAGQPVIANHCQSQIHFLFSLILTDNPNASRQVVDVVRRNLSSLLQAVSIMTKITDTTRPFFAQVAARFLASGDHLLQEKALSMHLNLLKQHIPHEYAQDLRNLLDDKTFRDQLVAITTTDMAKWRSSPSWHDHLLPALFRLLYGKMISRKKSTGQGRNSMEQRRKVILSSMASWPEEARSCFITMISGTEGEGGVEERRRAGFLAMLEPVLEHMGRSLSAESIRHLMCSVLDILEKSDCESSMAKRLRQAACKRLVLGLCKADPTIINNHIRDRIYALAIVPRLDKFEVELVQSKSSTVELLLFLADSDSYYTMLTAPVMTKVTMAIESAFVKPTVLASLLTITLSLIKHRHLNILDVPRLIKAVSEKTVREESTVVDKTVFALGVKMMQELAEFIESPLESKALIEMALGVLQRGRLYEQQKCQLVILVGCLFKQARPVVDAELVESMVLGLSEQLSTVVERESRQAIVAVFELFNESTPGWNSKQVSTIIASLESWSTEQIDEPDYDRRLQAMSWLRSQHHNLTTLQWTPLLHILLSCLLDPEEVALRNQAAGLIERFICAQPVYNVLSESVIYQTVKRHIAHKNEAVRVEMFAVLGQLVSRFGDTVSKYGTVKPLLAEGRDESNVFTCIGHLQVHRRARAIRQIIEFTESSANGTDPTVMVECLLPMLMRYCVYDADKGDAVPAPLVHMEACRTAGWVMGRYLPYNALFKTIRSLCRHLTSSTVKHPGADKQALKLLPNILSCFDHERVGVTIKQLSDHLLPVLFEAMKKNSTSISHPQLAVAVAELLARLPNELAVLYLPKLYSGLAMTCRSRLEDERREARQVLVTIVNLFPSTLPQSWSELTSVLTRGYQRHVLSHMLSYLLAADKVQYISDNSFITACTECILEDTLGEVAREKETEEWSGKITEARDCRSLSSLSVLVSKMAGGDGGAGGRLLRVLRMIEKFDTKRQEQVEKLLETILSVCVSNYDAVDLLLVAHELLQSDNNNLALFAIKLITSIIKRDQGKSRDRYASIINGLVPLVVNLWPHSGAVIKLVCLLLVEYSGLPAINDQDLLTRLLQSAFELIAKSSSQHQGDLIVAAFKYISILLRDRPEVSISEAQLRALVNYTSANLERLEHQTLTFTLIRSLLARRCMSAEVYELLKQVRNCAVLSMSGQCREQCLVTFMKFTSEYPMSEQRKLEHFLFYLDNVNYEAEGGRMSALQAVCQMAAVCRDSEEVSERAIKTLVLRIANETSESVKTQAVVSGVAVVKAVTERCVERVCTLAASKWLPNQRTNKCAWILLAVLMEADLPQKHNLITACLDTLLEINDDDDPLLILSVLAVLERVQLGDTESKLKVCEWMLCAHVPVRVRVDGLVLSWEDVEGCTEVIVQNAHKQLSEMTDVFGTDLTDLSVQLLFKHGDITDTVVKMERLLRRAGTSQFNTHVASALKYYGGLLATIQHQLDYTSLKTILSSCNRIITDQSIKYTDELKVMAEEVLGLARSRMERFEEAQLEVMTERAERRTVRRVSEKQLAVTDPQAAAALKLRRRARKHH